MLIRAQLSLQSKIFVLKFFQVKPESMTHSIRGYLIALEGILANQKSLQSEWITVRCRATLMSSGDNADSRRNPWQVECTCD